MKILLRNFWAALRKQRAVALLNLLGLSAAFVAFMLILMQVNFEYGFDKFRPGHDRLYVGEIEWDMNTDKTTPYAITTWPLASELLSSSPHIESGAVIYRMRQTVPFKMLDERQGEKTFTYDISFVSPEYPETIQLEMAEGQLRLEEPSQALIPQSLAKRMFGKRSPIGQRIEVEGDFTDLTKRREFYVSGVYRDIPGNSVIRNEVLVNLGDFKGSMWNISYRAYLLLDDPASKADVEAIGERIYSAEQSGTMHNFRLTKVSDLYFTPPNSDTARDPRGNRTVTFIFALAALLILGIAAVNFFNYSVAIIPMRLSGINMQKILGARRGSLRRGMLGESLLFVVVAYLVALLGLYLVEKSSLMNSLQTNMTLAGNAWILVLGFFIALSVGLLAALYPTALATSRPPAMVLKGSFALSGQGRRLRTAFVSFQYVVSIALIALAVFMNLQYSLLRQSDLGFDKEQILVLKLNKELIRQRHALNMELQANPDIRQTAFIRKELVSESMWEKAALRPDGQRITFQAVDISSGFLSLMGIRIYEGQGFSPSDDQKDYGTSEAAHRGRIPLMMNRKGQQQYDIRLGEQIGPYEVVGFFENLNVRPLQYEVEPFGFIAAGIGGWGEPDRIYMKVNAADYGALMGYVRETARKMDPSSKEDPYFLDAHIESLYRKDAQNTSLISFFSVLAILISLSGVFSLISFETRFKRKEIGVRRVFGASVEEILALFNRNYIRIVAVSFVLATPLAWYAVGLWLQNYTVKTPIYWWVFALVLLLVVVLTVLTVTLLTYKAATANPVKALQSE